IQLIGRKAQDADTQRMLAVMETSTHRGADMVRQVLTFSRGRAGENELLNLGQLVREMEGIARQTLPKSIAVAAMVPRDLWPVLGNATEIHQVLLNLCVNARDAMPDGGELTLAADNVELDTEEAKGIPNARPGSFVMLLVSDTGTGIAPEILTRLFEPFFTTKAPGQGTGLGLATLARIVANHGGFVSVKSEAGAGTAFEIYLPRAEVTSPPEPQDVLAELPRGRGELILFIDDERALREMMAASLVEYGYQVATASNGAEALLLLNRHGHDVRLVVSDLSMPMMNGVTLLATLRARRPDLPVVLMSGELDARKANATDGVAAFLAKPFRLEQLLAAVADALKRTPGAV
ncbi:MAG: response regulator, partial [Verrucomicrobia bacterium]|nr:response regulator [Verrucomicrobiota bacterium]